MKSTTGLFAIGLIAVLATAPSARAEVTLIDQNQFKLSVSGIIETDLDVDSTRSFREIEGNAPVARPGASGDNGRTQMSMRNSRLAFNVAAPEADGWKSRAYLEFDFLGFDPSPGTAGNNEGGLYNSPTMRVRHGYMQTEKNGWQLTAGQTWQLFGWQPYYFLSTVQVAPIAGMLYGRTAQIRGMNTVEMGASKLQTAVSISRPPQADAQIPDLQAGVRWSMDSVQSGFTGGGGAARRLMPLSVGLSGVMREYSISDADGDPSHTDHFNGYGIALDVFIPIIPSKSGTSGTLSLVGEFTTGAGDGDQFTSWTGGMANPLSTATNGTANGRSISIDGGEGDFDASGAFQMVKLQTYNLHLQYHLPNEIPGFVSLGAAQLISSNVDSLVGANGKNSAGGISYNRNRVMFVNYCHDLTAHLRTGLEYAYADTRYTDGVIAHDNRFQGSAWYTF